MPVLIKITVRLIRHKCRLQNRTMLLGSISMKTDISYSHISMWYTIKDVHWGSLQRTFILLLKSLP